MSDKMPLQDATRSLLFLAGGLVAAHYVDMSPMLRTLQKLCVPATPPVSIHYQPGEAARLSFLRRTLAARTETYGPLSQFRR